MTRTRTPRPDKTSPFQRPQARKAGRNAVARSRSRFAARSEAALQRSLALPRRRKGRPAMALPRKTRRKIYGFAQGAV